MRQWRYLASLLLSGLLTLAGCGDQAGPDPQDDPGRADDPQPVGQDTPAPDPAAEPLLGPEPKPVPRVVMPRPIDEGEWIGPINGLRFAVRPLGHTFDLDGSIPMLLLVHNTTGREVTWPGFRPEPSVRRDGVPDWKPAYDPDANLRVWMTPVRPDLLNNQSRQHIGSEGYRNYSSPPKTLGPGQTSINLFTIDADHRKRVRHDNLPHSPHTSMGMVWYDSSLPSGYTIKVRYQPGGFEPPEGKHRGVTLAGWEDVWVNFHPVDVVMMESSRR